MGIVFAALSGLLAPVSEALGSSRFSFTDVIRAARVRSLRPYAPPAQVPQSLLNLSYDQYQAIRFKPTKSLWYGSRRLFHVEPVPPGLYYRHCISMNVVNHRTISQLRFPKRDFTYPSWDVYRQIPDDSCIAGFKLTYPLRGAGIQNQFLVFAGASYFRAVGRLNRFGLSARGIAINTAFPPAEEFPAFRRFWLLEPQPNLQTMTIYALLDGPSVTGAYRFRVAPGVSTNVVVNAVLFFRKTPRVIGIAPLTSMFFYGQGTPRPSGEWRPAVHDSDGLQIENGNHEWLWRPLINPVGFLVSSFVLNNPLGFGLMQRDQRFPGYQDLEARYDLRPSAWVSPEGHWGTGHLELVEIPSNSETEDNIVAYWVPNAPPQPGHEYQYSYRVSFGRAGLARPPAGYVLHTFVGSGQNPGMPCTAAQDVLRFVVDFGGSFPPHIVAVDGVVSANASGQVSQVSVMKNTASAGYRLSFLVRVEPRHPLELRAFLHRGRDTLTETWSYLMPWSNARRLLEAPGCSTSETRDDQPLQAP